MSRVAWKETARPQPAHYEEYIAFVGDLRLCVRGPRGGSVYRYTVERVQGGARVFLAKGSCVVRDGAQQRAEYDAGQVKP